MTFWALPNIDAVYNKWEDDWWYWKIHSNKEQKEQKAQLKKDKETNKKASTLKDFNKVMSKMDNNEQMQAMNQMNSVAAKQNKIADADYQANFVKDNERKTVKKKDWTTVKTWVNKTTKEPVVWALNSTPKK